MKRSKFVKTPSNPKAADMIQMAKAKGPGGQGFLVDHNQFSDARPPGVRGQRKSAGYPSFIKN